MYKLKEEWGWSVREDDRAYGPFSSREEAVEDAKKNSKKPLDRVIFGRCLWANPVSHLPSMSDFLEELEDSAYNNGFSFWEDEIFSVDTWEVAEKEFDEMLKNWADKYVKGSCWQLIPENIKDTE